MRKLSELGISPAPWSFTDDGIGEYDIRCSGVSYGEDYEGDDIIASMIQRKDAPMFAAAPALYSEGYDDCVALRAIVHRMDEGVEMLNLRDTLAKMADRIEAALSRASGESEVRHG